MSPPPTQYPQFLLLGDSLIQYSTRLHPQNDDTGKPVHGLGNVKGRGVFSFGAALAEKCERRLDVVNRGFSGYNTSNILFILDDIVPNAGDVRVEYLLLLLGANDACLPTSPTNQHIPLETYRQNLKTILTHPSITSHNPTILLVTPPPVHEPHLQSEDLRKGNGGLTRTQKVTGKYAQVVRDVGKELKSEGKGRDVRLVDLWGAMMGDVGAHTKTNTEIKNTGGGNGEGGGEGEFGELWEGGNKRFYELLFDGLHMSGEGYRVFFDAVIAALGGKWEDEAGEVDKRDWVFPKWDDAPRV